MQEFQLGYHRRLRFVVGPGFPSLSTMDSPRLVITGTRHSSGESLTQICEVYVPRGPRIIYGLLGFTFEPLGADSLRVFFPVAQSTAAQYSSRLFQGEIIVGCLAEYLGFIEEGFNSDNFLTCPSGILKFNYCCYSEISSNGWVFKKLAHILRLVLSGSNLSKDDYRSILDATELSM